MKKVKIFLASSIEDLRDDRITIGDYFRQLNDIYSDFDVYFSLIKCEDYDNSISRGGKQSRYDDEIRGSELCFFLFYRKIGEYTKHEFEVALESFRDCEKPKIVTYFKDVACADEMNEDVNSFMRMLDEELHHYYSSYGHIDTLKLGILMQIKLMHLDSADVSIEDGEIKLNGGTLLYSKNVPMLNGLDNLRELTDKKRELTVAKDAARASYLADATPENENKFFDASAKLNKVSKALTEAEREALAFVTTVAELSTDGRVLTARQREALKYYGEGNYKKAQLILEDAERENELERAENRAANAERDIQGYVEENLLWIKAAEARGITSDVAKSICEKFEKAVELTERYNLNNGVLYQYAIFLKKQNSYKAAIKIAERLKWHYDCPRAEVADEDRGRLLNLLGGVYSRIRDYENAAKSLLGAREIYKRLSAVDPDTYEPPLATTYGNLGYMYKGMNRFDKAEDAYLSALEINERLAKRNPDAYESALSISYNNIGVLYDDLDSFDKAENAYLAALEIDKRLAAKDPDRYESDLARSYNNVGGVYRSCERYEEAEKMILSAIVIRKRLAGKNPAACEPALAASYNNIWGIYNSLKRYNEAEGVLLSAIEIYKRLVLANPEAFVPELARSYRNAGIMYASQGLSDKASAAYSAAIEIYEQLSEKSEFAREIFADRLTAIKELQHSLI